MRAEKNDKSPAKITPDVLRNLQAALNDSIKPDYREKKEGNNAPKKKRRKRNRKTKEEK